MPRYPPIAPSALTAAQHKAYEEASEICSDIFGDKFLYKNEDGAFIGPFAPLLYTPSLVDPFFKLVVELGKLPGLPGPAREIAIRTSNGKHIQVHISSVKSGKKPIGDNALDEQGDIAFDVAIEPSHKQVRGLMPIGGGQSKLLGRKVLRR